MGIKQTERDSLAASTYAGEQMLRPVQKALYFTIMDTFIYLLNFILYLVLELYKFYSKIDKH